MIIFGLFLLLIFLLALTANRLARTVLTAPMIFTLVGILIVMLLPTVTQSEVESESILFLGEIALTLVLLSIFAHGLSANPTISRYTRRIARLGPDAPENLAVVEMPTRTRLRVKHSSDLEPSHN